MGTRLDAIEKPDIAEQLSSLELARANAILNYGPDDITIPSNKIRWGHQS